MQCSSCGTQLSPGAVACPCCGEPAPAEIVERISTPPGSQLPAAVPQPTISGTGIPQETSPVAYGTQTNGTIQPPQQNMPLQPYHVLAQPQLSIAQQVSQGQQHRSFTVRITTLAILLALLIIGASSIGYYAAVVRPAQFQTQATAVTRDLLATQAQGTAQSYAEATATSAALTPQDIYTKATSGIPVINDALDGHEASSWLQLNSPLYSCAFSSGAYHIRVLSQQSSAFCIAYNSLFNNLAFQVQLTIISGGLGGLVFRIANNGAYLFTVDQQGRYVLAVIKNNVLPTILAASNDAAIKIGPNQPNLLTVVAESNRLYLYINKQLAVNISNGAYSSGQIGLFAASGTDPADVAFNNVQVWAL